MKDYVIITDSTTDLSAELVSKYDLNIIPMKFKTEGREYINYPDGHDLSNEEFYKEIRSGKIFTTSQVSPQEFIDAYTPFLEKGLDILALCFSSGLSGTLNSLHLAKGELLEKFPERKILVVDTLCASMGEGLLAFYASKFRNEGMNLEENHKKLEELKLHIAHWFTVSDIDFLKRGGRLSNASAFLAKALHINPVLHVDNNGHLINRFKKIGRKSAIKEILSQFAENKDSSFKQTIFISHADCLNDALYLKEQILKIYDPEEIVIGEIGPVIGSHAGPGTLALFFVSTHR